MSSSFIAIASRKRGTFVITSTVSVYQIRPDGLRIPIADIHDSADPADHRNTEIFFLGGRLNFAAAYDGPLMNHSAWHFTDENHRRVDLSLHAFSLAKKTYICSSDGFFPVITYCNRDTFTITVYQSSPTPREDGLLFSVLATITQTSKYENGFEYAIKVEKEIPTSLLMSVFSLPFTLLNLC